MCGHGKENMLYMGEACAQCADGDDTARRSCKQCKLDPSLKAPSVSNLDSTNKGMTVLST